MMLHFLGGQPYYTNCFLLVGEQGNAVAIDPAARPEEFFEALESNNAKLQYIFLTHGHHDHIGAVEDLRQRTGAKLVMNEADAKQFGLKADSFFTDYGKMQVDDMEFTTVFTPGHTPGSTVIACGDHLFTGDTLFAGDIGRTDLPGGNAAEMKSSLKKLCIAFDDDKKVYPGHEEFSTLDEEKRSNPYLRF